MFIHVNTHNLKKSAYKLEVTVHIIHATRHDTTRHDSTNVIWGIVLAVHNVQFHK